MIHVIARIETHPGKREAFLLEFQRLVPLVLQESGCIEYGAAVDADTDLQRQHTDENLVMIIEKWESIRQLEAHLAAEHMNSYRERVAALVASTRLQVLDPVRGDR